MPKPINTTQGSTNMLRPSLGVHTNTASHPVAQNLEIWAGIEKQDFLPSPCQHKRGRWSLHRKARLSHVSRFTGQEKHLTASTKSST